MTEEPYIRANGRFLPTGLYDRGIAVTMREGAWRPRLVAGVLDGAPADVLDLGCGTGTLAISLAAEGEAAVTGVDGDPEILDRARAKPGSEAVAWVEGMADQLPFADGSFDRVVSSLLFHHLQPPTKRTALAESLRVLRPGGRLHVADWGRAQDPLMRAMFGVLQLLDGVPNTREHAEGKVAEMIADAGFADVLSEARLRTAWGSLEILSARRAS